MLNISLLIALVLMSACLIFCLQIYLAIPVQKLKGDFKLLTRFKGMQIQFGLSSRATVTLEDLPANLLLALFFCEDPKFLTHQGFQWSEILRRLKLYLRGKEKLAGGSSITQQLAKNIFLGAKRRWKNKFYEILITIKLERNFTKEELLRLYLSICFLGYGTMGVKAASKKIFNSELAQLNLAQSLILVLLLRNPVSLLYYISVGAVHEKFYFVAANKLYEIMTFYACSNCPENCSYEEFKCKYLQFQANKLKTKIPKSLDLKLRRLAEEQLEILRATVNTISYKFEFNNAQTG